MYPYSRDRVSRCRKRTHSCLRCLLAAFVTALLVSDCSADETNAEKIRALSNSGRQGFLRAMIETYREAAESISTDQVQYAQVVRYNRDTGEIGHEVLQSSVRERCRILRDGASHRVTRWAAQKDPEPVSPVVYEESYDANADVSRSLFVNTANGQTSFQGSIKRTSYGLNECFIFRYYLAASGVEQLLRELDQAQVTVSREHDGILEATFPINRSARRVSNGKVCFDLNRKGLATRYLVEIFNRAGDAAEPIPRETRELIVDKVEEANGIWIPTRARYLVWASNRSDTMTVWRHELSILRAQESPIEIRPVEFPLGTKVFDQINSRRYDVGLDGRKINERDARADVK